MADRVADVVYGGLYIKGTKMLSMMQNSKNKQLLDILACNSANKPSFIIQNHHVFAGKRPMSSCFLYAN